MGQRGKGAFVERNGGPRRVLRRMAIVRLTTPVKQKDRIRFDKSTERFNIETVSSPSI